MWVSLSLSTAVYYHTVALAVDRVVAILAPFWHRSLNKALTARRISLVTSIGAFLLTAVAIPITQWNQETKSCSYKPNSPPYYISVYMLIVLVIIPMVLLVFANAVFMWALKKRPSAGQNINSTEAGRSREKERRKNDNNYVLMMVVTTCAFIVLRLCGLGFEVEAVRRSGLNNGGGEFFWALGRLCIILNSSLNLIFYSSSEMFRKALRDALKSILKAKAPSQHPNN